MAGTLTADAPASRSATAPLATLQDEVGPPPCRFSVARSVDDVATAWSLLYQAYRRAGYISENPYGLHTVKQAIGRHTAVVTAKVGSRAVGTISAMADSRLGLPLDAVYRDELKLLRWEGRRLVEVGLLGEAGSAEVEGAASSPVFDLMRYSFWFTYYVGGTDFICGIPPRRARLYNRSLGFEPIGPVKSYATVEDNPVVLMRVETSYVLQHHKKHRGLDYFIRNPVPRSAFERRFDFRVPAVESSNLAAYLRDQQGYAARNVA